MTAYTTNYHLDLYEETDKPNLADQYNAAIQKIDGELQTQSGDIAKTSNDLININKVIGTINEDVQTANANAQAANSAAQAVKATADEAKAAAETATTTANAANEAANSVKGTADSALATAQQAQTTANGAATSASTAKATADTAQTTANRAANDAARALSLIGGGSSETAGNFVSSNFVQLYNKKSFTGGTMESFFAYNDNRTVMKFWGFMTVSAAGTLTLDSVPGATGIYGYDTGIIVPGWSGGYRTFNATGFTSYSGSRQFNQPVANASWNIGSNGHIYAMNQTTASLANQANDFRIWFQIPCYIASDAGWFPSVASLGVDDMDFGEGTVVTYGMPQGDYTETPDGARYNTKGDGSDTFPTGGDE